VDIYNPQHTGAINLLTNTLLGADHKVSKYAGLLHNAANNRATGAQANYGDVLSGLFGGGQRQVAQQPAKDMTPYMIGGGLLGGVGLGYLMNKNKDRQQQQPYGYGGYQQPMYQQPSPQYGGYGGYGGYPGY
jgi:hypothetical protein